MTPTRLMRGRVLFTVLAAVCLAAALPTGMPGAPAAAEEVVPGSVPPDQDPFYSPPQRLPESNGALIRARAFTAYVSEIAVNVKAMPVPARGWQIMYRTTDAAGHPIAVTGAVFVPYSPWPGDRPVIGYSPGTVGPGDRCAPSYGLARGSWYESVLPVDALTAGYAVVIPDLEGMGVPTDPTYLTGSSEGHAVLDGLRAAQRLPDAALSPDTPAVLWGYSQGGHATAWAGQLQPDYAPELNLKGIAVGGLPGDLGLVLDNVEEVGLHLAAWVYLGWHQAYPGLPWGSLLTPLGQQKMAEAQTSCEVDPDQGLLGTDNGTSVFQGLTMPDIFTANPRTRSAWRSAVTQNSPGSLAPKAPVYMYGSQADEIVPYAAQRSVYHDWCQIGANVQWHDTLPLNHVGAAFAGNPAALAWITSRFAGQPSSSSC
jgi:hypothetical protein